MGGSAINRKLLKFWLFLLSTASLIFLIHNCSLGGVRVIETVSGKQLRVVVQEDGKDTVIGNAAVVVTNISTNKRYTKLTDNSGVALFIGLDIGVYKVEVSKEGYQSSETTVVLDTPKEIIVYLKVEQSPNTVSGKIYDADTNEPISGAAIEVRDADNAMTFYGSARSDSDGEYVVYLKNLPTDRDQVYLKVGVTATGYKLAEKYPILTIGEYIKDLDFALKKATTEDTGKAQLTGIVKDAVTNQLLSGVQVYLKGEGFENTKVTDSFGVFSFSDLTSGKYLLVVKDSNNKYQPYMTELDLSSGLNTITIELHLVGEGATCELRGLVIDKDTGATVEGAVVGVLFEGGSKEVTTDSAGKFEFKKLETGQVTMYVLKDGYKPYNETFTLNAGLNLKTIKLEKSFKDSAYLGVTVYDESGKILSFPSDEATIYVQIFGNGSTIEMEATYGLAFPYVEVSSEIDYVMKVWADYYYPTVETVNLRPSEVKQMPVVLFHYKGSIGGRIIDKDSEMPVASATIVLTSDIKTYTGQTDDNGYFSFDTLPYGTYDIYITADYYQSTSEEIVLDATNPTYFKVYKLENSQTANIVVLLKDYSTGQPIKKASVELVYNGSMYDFTSQGSGVYVYQGATANVLLVLLVTAENFVTTTESFTLKLGETKVMNVNLRPMSFTIGGVVVDKTDHSKIQDAFVVVYGEGTYAVTTSAADGSFNVTGLRAGTYSVRVSADGYNTYSTEEILLGKATPSVFLEVELSKFKGTLIGWVLDASSSAPISGAQVNCVYGNETTDTSGFFKFEDLPSGEILLNFYAAGYEFVTKSVTVNGGDVASITVKLPPAAGGIEGRLRTPDFEPLEKVSVEIIQLGLVATTESDGSFRFTGVPAGDYLIYAFSPTIEATYDNITVNYYATAYVELITERKTTPELMFYVYDASTSLGIEGATVRVLWVDEKTSEEVKTATYGFTTLGVKVIGKKYIYLVYKEEYATYSSDVIEAPTSNVLIKVPLAPITRVVTVTVENTIDNSPIAGARVEITEGDNVGYVGYTNSKGVLVLPPVSKYSTVSVHVTKGDNFEDGYGSAGANEKQILVKLIPKYALVYGTVEDSEGYGMKNVHVYEESELLATTNSTGEFSLTVLLTDVVGKVVNLRFERDGYEVLYKTFYVSRGASYELVATMESLPSGSVTFKLMDKDGGLISSDKNATIEIVGALYSTTAVFKGPIQTIELPSGEYTAIATADWYCSSVDSFIVGAGESLIREIQLSPKKGKVWGYVYIRRIINGATFEEPLENVSVVVKDSAGNVEEVITNSSGLWFATVEYGTCSIVRAYHPTYGIYDTYEVVNKTGSISVFLDEPATQMATLIFYDKYWYITGEIYMKYHKDLNDIDVSQEIPPFASVTVKLLGYDEATWSTAVVNNGQYIFRGVPERKSGYKIYVISNEFYPLFADVGYTVESRFTGPTLELSPKFYKVSGRALDLFYYNLTGNDKEIPGVTIEVYDLLENSVETRVNADFAGSFEFSVPIGVYRIVAASPERCWLEKIVSSSLVATADVNLGNVYLFPSTETVTGSVYLDEDKDGVKDADEDWIRVAKNYLYKDTSLKILYTYRGLWVSTENYVDSNSSFELVVPVATSSCSYLGVDAYRTIRVSAENKLANADVNVWLYKKSKSLKIGMTEYSSIGAWICGRLIDAYLYNLSGAVLTVNQATVGVYSQDGTVKYASANVDAAGVFRVYIPRWPEEKVLLRIVPTEELSLKCNNQLVTERRYATLELYQKTSAECNVNTTYEINPVFGVVKLVIKYDARFWEWEFKKKNEWAVAYGVKSNTLHAGDWNMKPDPTEELITNITPNYYNEKQSDSSKKIAVQYPGIDLSNFTSDIRYSYWVNGYSMWVELQNMPGAVITLTHVPVGSHEFYVSAEGFWTSRVYRLIEYNVGDGTGTWEGIIGVCKDVLVTAEAAMMPMGVNAIVGYYGSFKVTDESSDKWLAWKWWLASDETNYATGYVEFLPMGWRYPLNSSSDPYLFTVYSFPASGNPAWILPHPALLPSYGTGTGEYGAYYYGTVFFSTYGAGIDQPKPPDPTVSVKLYAPIPSSNFYVGPGGYYGDFSVTAEQWFEPQIQLGE